MSMSTHLYVKHPRTTQLNVVLYKSHIIIIIITYRLGHELINDFVPRAQGRNW